MDKLDDLILNELDKQNIRSEQIYFIMNKLDDEEKKNLFLAYMIENRHILLTFSEVLKEVGNYENE